MGAEGDDAGLAILGLRQGETVRWQAAGVARWRSARVLRREGDGSVGVVDDRGMVRSLTVARVEVARRGPRGGAGWEPLTARASRCEQLVLAFTGVG